MNDAAEAPQAIIIEHMMRHPIDKVWRALTQSWLIEEWLMPNDFELRIGHRFSLRSAPRSGWSGVTICEVVRIEEPNLLAYTWQDGSGEGPSTIVTWSLSSTAEGTLLRLEHSGFGPGDEKMHKGLTGGWPHIVERLEAVIEKRTEAT